LTGKALLAGEGRCTTRKERRKDIRAKIAERGGREECAPRVGTPGKKNDSSRGDGKKHSPRSKNGDFKHSEALGHTYLRPSGEVYGAKRNKIRRTEHQGTRLRTITRGC